MSGKRTSGRTPSEKLGAPKTLATDAGARRIAPAAKGVQASGVPEEDAPAVSFCPEIVNEFWHRVRDLETAAVVARWGVKGLFARWDYEDGRLETRGKDANNCLQEYMTVLENGVSRMGGFSHRPSIETPKLFAAELRRLLKLLEECRNWERYRWQPGSEELLKTLENAGVLLGGSYESQPLISAISRLLLDLPGPAKPVLARTDGCIDRALSALVDAIAWTEEQAASRRKNLSAQGRAPEETSVKTVVSSSAEPQGGLTKLPESRQAPEGTAAQEAKQEDAPPQPQPDAEPSLKEEESLPAQPAEGDTTTEKADRHQDGPEDPHFFWWKGKPRVLKVQPKQWNLLKCIWPNEKTSLQTIGAEVWGDRYREYTRIKFQVSRLNTAFEPLGIPLLWEKSGDFLVLRRLP